MEKLHPELKVTFKKLKLSVIVPVYNEFDTILEIMDQVLALDLNLEVIIIDDGSNDGTKELVDSLKPKVSKVIHHPTNLGKGAAVWSGLQQATGDYVIIQDADLEYDPQDYFLLLRPIVAGKAEVVYGSRFTGEHRNMFFWHWVGNKFLTLLTNILYNTTLSDMETCYKLFCRKDLQGITVHSRGFAFEPEITAKILKRGIRIYEVPISYTGREFHEGKKIRGLKDGLLAFWTLLKYRFVD